MRLEFLAEARQEFRAAALHYELRQPGLEKGSAVMRDRDRARGYEVAQVCAAIRRDPLLWRERRAGYRRVNCPVFPFYIAFVIDQEVIRIAAVAHAHRHPDYWKDRLPQ